MTEESEQTYPEEQSASFAQGQFGQVANRIRIDYLRFNRSANALFWTAVTLKGVSIFGGIAVTSGYLGENANLIGIAIAVAAGLDLIFAPYARMNMYRVAAGALDQLHRRIVKEQTVKVVAVKKNRNMRTQLRMLSELYEGLLNFSHDEHAKIIKATYDKEIELLASLKFEHRTEEEKVGK